MLDVSARCKLARRQARRPRRSCRIRRCASLRSLVWQRPAHRVGVGSCFRCEWANVSLGQRREDEWKMASQCVARSVSKGRCWRGWIHRTGSRPIVLTQPVRTLQYVRECLGVDQRRWTQFNEDHEGRILPLRQKLLPPLSARCSAAGDPRHKHMSYRLSLRSSSGGWLIDPECAIYSV